MIRIRTSGPMVAGAVLATGLLVGALPASAAFAHPAKVAPRATPTAKAAPSKNLTNGKVVNVSGKGWPAHDTLVVVECNANAATSDTNACNQTALVSTSASSKGAVKTQFTFFTGAVGDGTCNARQTCYLVLTEPAQTGLHALMKVTVSKKP